MDNMVKQIIWKSFILLIVVFTFGMIVNNKEIYIGFTLGGIIAVVNLIMIAIDVEVVVKSGIKAKKVAVFRFVKRYFWSFLIITVAVKVFRFSNFIGLIAGLFLIQAIIFVERVILRKESK